MKKIKVFVLAYESKVTVTSEGEVTDEYFQTIEQSFTSKQDLIDFIQQVLDQKGRIISLESYNEEFYTEEEMQEVKDQVIELHEKLENAWGFVDNIREHLEELESDMDSLTYDIDHAKDDCDSALCELED